MAKDQDSPNGGANVQDVMSAWIAYAILLVSLAVCAFAFDFTASVADRMSQRLAAPAEIGQQLETHEPAAGRDALSKQ